MLRRAPGRRRLWCLRGESESNGGTRAGFLYSWGQQVYCVRNELERKRLGFEEILIRYQCITIQARTICRDPRNIQKLNEIRILRWSVYLALIFLYSTRNLQIFQEKFNIKALNILKLGVYNFETTWHLHNGWIFTILNSPIAGFFLIVANLLIRKPSTSKLIL